MDGSNDASFQIELRHIRYFIAAAQHGSFRRASMQIGIKESGISRCVSDLEYRLGALLFHRYSGGVCLTTAGRRFLERALQIVRDVGDGIRDVALIGQGQTGLIKVGIVSSLSSKFIGELIKEFREQHKGVFLEFTETGPEDQISSIFRPGLDMAFVPMWMSSEDFSIAPLWQERLFAALPEGHDLSLQEAVEWKDLVGEQLVLGRISHMAEIRKRLTAHTADFIHFPKLNVHHISQCNLLALVAIERSVTLIYESSIAIQFPGVVYRPIKDEFLQIGATWTPSNNNPSLPHLIHCVMNVRRRLDS